MTITRRQFATAALLILGTSACCNLYPRSHAFNRGIPGRADAFADDVVEERVLIAVAAIFTLIPATRRWLIAKLDALRTPSPRTQRLIAIATFVFSQPLLYLLAVVRGRVLLPYWHDENFYRLQTTFFAHGKLSGPAHPLADFFDVPYVFMRPRFAVAYFPGTAMLHVPAAWLHLPYFIMPLFIAGITLALLYLIATDLIDGVTGLLSVILMLSLPVFRWMALIEMSHAAGAMWGLIVIWCWLKCRHAGGRRWVILAALAAGWYAITRPLDATLILFPIMLAWALDLRGINRRSRFAIAATFVLILLPFAAFQLAFDRALTGHFLQSPMGLYYRTYMNLRGVGLERLDAAFHPPTSSRLILDTYENIVVPRVRDFSDMQSATMQWITQRVPGTFGSTLPTMLLIIPIPVALMAMYDRRRCALLFAAGFYIVGSGFVFQYLDHYVMAVAAIIIILLLIGIDAVARVFPACRMAAVFLPLAVLLLAMHRLCLNDQGAFQNLGPGVMQANYQTIPAKIAQPAIVLFRYDESAASGAFDEEPVYNWDVMNPDDAPIIRAHDLGNRNRELFKYYAKSQPDRNVYLFDRGRLKLQFLGKAKDLATAEN